ncbi:MAG: BON domain-containing protein [Xanthomonadales bacterium]|nr:BON domain-containing protein [Xanthomonadales bacterium]
MFPVNSKTRPGAHAIRLGRSLLALLLAVVLSGCAAAVVGGAAVVATDRRTAGTMLDDQTLEVKVSDKIYGAPAFAGGDHVKVEVYQGVVLLLGEVTTEEKRVQAGTLASEVPYVKRVVNDLVVDNSATVGQRLDNTWLTTKVNTALVTKNPVSGFDATRIKVVTSRDTVYLMGLVSREEGDAVAEVARNVGGVAKVVKVFSYTD